MQSINEQQTKALRKPKRFVVTGGPSGGKTTFINEIKNNKDGLVEVVPEAATILFRGGFPRKRDTKSVMHSQRAIFHVQNELEELIGTNSACKLILCDRGTVDGLAYWPGSSSDFFKTMGTTLTAQISRYDFVLHLDTAQEAYYDLSNPLRIETYEEAVRVNQKLIEAWSPHPHRFHIHSHYSFKDKIKLAMRIVDSILEERSYESIVKELPEIKPIQNS